MLANWKLTGIPRLLKDAEKLLVQNLEDRLTNKRMKE